ncbi:MAG TPA: family 78 glycoside hydrolase catalytic domain [Phycisphaerae bacterium]|nr:family 78 glycoside hydrolase catalytic domain [Phycisphaerae bacterium]
MNNPTAPRRILLAGISGLLITGTSALAQPAHSLTVGEEFVNPLGYYNPNPVFSWKLPPGVKKQTAYRLDISVDGQARPTDWVQSDQSTYVPWVGAPLASRDRVTWRVNFRDQAGNEGGWSEPATVEEGLLSAADWHAKWIRPAGPPDPQKESVANLRRSFPISKPIARARLYVTARGLFELQLNGQPVSSDHFANGFTPYLKRIDTLTYDVASLLRQGDNSLSALLGDGWYAGRFPFAAKTKGFFGKNPALLLQLEITYADGTQDTIVSDEQWQGAFDGPIVSSSIYDGEDYDARRQPSDWKPVIADADLGPQALMPKPFAPVRQTNTLSVQNITQPQSGHFIFDLGQNMVGWARINVPAEKDKTITIRFAEMLKDDGTLYTDNYRTAKSTDTYTAAQTGAIQWEPHFTFHGFRYVELSGLPQGATPRQDWVTGIVLHSDLPTIGSFASSSDMLDKLQSNIIWGWRGNSFDIPTDCPQRDERLGWTGDAEVFCPTAMFNTDAHAFWKSWLGSMRLDQLSDGAIPDTVPNVIANNNRSPGWMDAATIIPWDVYVRTGDTEMLSQNYEMMQKLVAWYRAQSTDHLLPDIKGYGDWLQPYQQTPPIPGDSHSDRIGDTPRPLLGAAFYAHSAQILADTARILGKTDDAHRYAAEAASVRDAFAKAYFDADGTEKITPETQTAYVLAIAFHLLPDDLAPKAADNLVRMVHDAGDHLRTGFLGTPFLCAALDQTGHSDLAATLLFQQTYPSWFYPINQGATTMWERWNSYTKDKGFGDASMNSFNHYAYGAIGQWMYQRVAGLAPDPDHPGYKHFFIRPLFITQLNAAHAELDTPFGRASSAWTRDAAKISLDVTVPPNTTATIDFTDGRSQTLDPGASHFDLPAP